MPYAHNPFDNNFKIPHLNMSPRKNLLQTNNGERIYTNMIHLSEIIYEKESYPSADGLELVLMFIKKWVMDF